MWKTIKHWLWAEQSDFTIQDAYNEGYAVGKHGLVLFMPSDDYTPGQVHAYAIGNLNALNMRLNHLERAKLTEILDETNKT